MGYFCWVSAGLVLAALAFRWQPRAVALPPHERQALRLAALAGAIVGAFALQLPADLAGLCAPPPAALGGDALPLGGRTVLGGLLGGWLAVEIRKKVAGIRQPTGGEFALPLALALCCGRMGCLAAGCCAGAQCPPAWYATLDAAGVPRFPVQLLEASFHGAAAVVLAAAARNGWWATRRLAAYLTCYAVVRFLLEFWRQHPAVALGLTWHQFLALALFALAGSTWWSRDRSANGAQLTKTSEP